MFLHASKCISIHGNETLLPIRPHGFQGDDLINCHGAGIQAREKLRTGSLCLSAYLLVTLDSTIHGETKTARGKKAQPEIYF